MALRSTDDTTNGQGTPGRPTVAAFDFDGTLTDAGSAFPFLISLRGLLPVLWARGTGADVMKRIAAPMVGGVVTSALLELVVYPALYMLWKARRLPETVSLP